MCEKNRYYEETYRAQRRPPKVGVQVLAIWGEAELPSGKSS